MKLATFKNPISGASGNLFNVADWTQNIIGVMFLFVVIAMGQGLVKKVSNKVPMVDSTIEPFVTNPQTGGFQKFTV